LALANQQTQAGLSASTLYRFLRARGLTERQLLLDKASAHKKYEAQFANQIWQSDMLFGPWVERPGGGKQQVFLQAALDDASRLIPHAQFYPNQGLDAFLDCLRHAIAARGIPTRLYMDNAKPAILDHAFTRRQRLSLHVLLYSSRIRYEVVERTWSSRS